MKKIIALIIIVASTIQLVAQIDSLRTVSLIAAIRVTDMEKIELQLQQLFNEERTVPDFFYREKSKLTTRFELSEKRYYSFEKQLENWGYVESIKIESINYNDKLNTIDKKIERLQKEVIKYEDILSKVNVQSENHVRYWEKLEMRKDELRSLLRLKDDYRQNNKRFEVELTLKEENMMSYEPDFSFVNMPGLQYSFLNIENPVDSLFPENMNGYSLKYLLNRRKTYIELGLYRANGESVTTTFSEMYTFGIGQDFYSTHLGRGARRFLNLYSGFKIGVFYLSSDTRKITSWYATPSLGIEIFKTKNILLDNKLGYYLPFKENKNLRGLIYDISFNVVF